MKGFLLRRGPEMPHYNVKLSVLVSSIYFDAAPMRAAASASCPVVSPVVERIDDVTGRPGFRT
jgi:hypothetical protein